MTVSHPPGGIRPSLRYTHLALDDAPEQADLLATVLADRPVLQRLPVRGL